MFEGDIQDGTEVFDKDGHRIGTVGQVFVLEGTDTPTWVTVHTGLFGMQESFVPLADATMRGSELVVPYEKGVVKQAPRVAEADDLTAEQEAHLYRYYEVDPPQRSAETAGAARGEGGGAAAPHRLDDQPYDERGAQGGQREHDVDAGAEGQASPDRAGAAAAPRPGRDGTTSGAGAPGSGGTPRLRRRVVTEMQTVQVPVQREEIVVEGDGIASGDEGDGIASGAEDDDRRERR